MLYLEYQTHTIRSNKIYAHDYIGNVETLEFASRAEVGEYIIGIDMGVSRLHIDLPDGSEWEFEGDWPTSDELFDWMSAEVKHQIEHSGHTITIIEKAKEHIENTEHYSEE